MLSRWADAGADAYADADADADTDAGADAYADADKQMRTSSDDQSCEMSRINHVIMS